MGKRNVPKNSKYLTQKEIVKYLINGSGGAYSFDKKGRIRVSYIGLLSSFNVLMCNVALRILYHCCIKRIT